MNQSNTRIRNLETGNIGSAQAADKGRLPFFPAKTNVGRSADDLPFRIFEIDCQFSVRIDIADRLAIGKAIQRFPASSKAMPSGKPLGPRDSGP